MNVIAVVGTKNTGKTTLVSRLVAAFKKTGLRVATCKHDGGHDFEIDVPETDTWKHRQAGADITLIASRSHMALQLFYEEEPSLDVWLEQLKRLPAPPDLVLVEGWKRSALPKIVLLGPEKIEQLSNVVAYVRAGEPESIADQPSGVYDREDIVGLVQLIQRLMEKRNLEV
ncbi:MAG: molybdopterin-guanine dinucleotide biosynthesis protein B [Tumebacillaceae bacterium]